MVVTDDENLFKKIVELKDQGRPFRGTGGDDIHHSRGYNFKFTNIQAAVGLGQLNYLYDRMQRLAKTYEICKHLKNIDGINILPFNTQEGELPLWTDIIINKIDDFIEFFDESEIDYRRFWLPLHQQKPYKLNQSIFQIQPNYLQNRFGFIIIHFQ